ncbi:hypothetical protein E4U61_001153 [Claviceps capensis]|nr:hypothetical protein E4U61_001153 [Claviceps capensis]
MTLRQTYRDDPYEHAGTRSSLFEHVVSLSKLHWAVSDASAEATTRHRELRWSMEDVVVQACRVSVACGKDVTACLQPQLTVESYMET